MGAFDSKQSSLAEIESKLSKAKTSFGSEVFDDLSLQLEHVTKSMDSFSATTDQKRKKIIDNVNENLEQELQSAEMQLAEIVSKCESLRTAAHAPAELQEKAASLMVSNRTMIFLFFLQKSTDQIQKRYFLGNSRFVLFAVLVYWT